MRLLVSPSQYWVRRRGIARYPLCSGVCEMPKGVAIRKGQPPTVEPDLRNRSLYSSYLMVPTSGFIRDPRTIPDRCVASERVCIADKLWVVGCNPLFETRFSCCFPASKVHKAPKSSEKCEKRAVRPHLFGSERIFSILLPSGMLVAPENRGYAWKYAVSCAFANVVRRCMHVLPSLRRFRFERQRSPSAHLVRRRGGTPCWNFLFGCSCPGPVRNRDRVVDALSIDGSGGSVGRAVGHYSDSNVTGQGTRHLVEGTLDPVVRLHFIIFRMSIGAP